MPKNIVIAGVGDFDDAFVCDFRMNLANIEADTTEWKHLAERSGYNLSEDNILPLVNAQATKAAVIGAIEKYTAFLVRGDQFTFVWIGHGAVITNKPKAEHALFPYDSHQELIYHGEIVHALQRAIANGVNVVLVIDACSVFRKSGTRCIVNTRYRQLSLVLGDDDVQFMAPLIEELRPNKRTLRFNKQAAPEGLGSCILVSAASLGKESYFGTIGGGRAMLTYLLTRCIEASKSSTIDMHISNTRRIFFEENTTDQCPVAAWTETGHGLYF